MTVASANTSACMDINRMTLKPGISALTLTLSKTMSSWASNASPYVSEAMNPPEELVSFPPCAVLTSLRPMARTHHPVVAASGAVVSEGPSSMNGPT